MVNLVPICDAVVAAGGNFDRWTIYIEWDYIVGSVYLRVEFWKALYGRFYGSTYTNTIEMRSLKEYIQGIRQQSHTLNITTSREVQPTRQT